MIKILLAIFTYQFNFPIIVLATCAVHTYDILERTHIETFNRYLILSHSWTIKLLDSLIMRTAMVTLILMKAWIDLNIIITV